MHGSGAREIGNVARNTLIGPGSVTWDTRAIQELFDYRALPS